MQSLRGSKLFSRSSSPTGGGRNFANTPRRDWFRKSVLLERVRLITFEQEWVKSGDDSVGIKDAGFKVLQVFIVTSGLSRRRA